MAALSQAQSAARDAVTFGRPALMGLRGNGASHWLQWNRIDRQPRRIGVDQRSDYDSGYSGNVSVAEPVRSAGDLVARPSQGV